ncbi:MAG: hypothetical protein RLZZ511_2080 [Cyanobacteriota bacterium]|jgi:uncharacterized protein YceH (UPF0502 family)
MTPPPSQSNPLFKAFFLGQAAIELAAENAGKVATEILSELGKFDAEQRVNLQQFMAEVQQRADQAMQQKTASPTTSATPTDRPNGRSNADLQATIDNLRAEIAEVRTELQRYRSQLN